MMARGQRASGLFSIEAFFRGICEPPKGRKKAPPGRAGQKGTGILHRQTQFRSGDTTVYTSRPCPPIPGRGPASKRRDTPISNATLAGGPEAARRHRDDDIILAAIGRLAEKSAASARDAR